MSLYALSTSWNANRHDNGIALIHEIQQAGFNHIEAEYRLSAEMLTDLISLHKKNEINIVSIHNFCPVPDILKREQGSGDALLLTSLDEDERKLAVKYSKKTIEIAVELGGIPVVFHTGYIQVQGRHRSTHHLVELIKQNKTNERDQAYREMQITRQKYIAPHFDQLLRSLDELNEFGFRYGIKLGIENRYHFYDIPNFAELAVIFTTFAGGSIGYWHDVGHGQMFEFLGINKHTEFLDTYADKMIGIHLHDMVDDQDHQAPGKGNIDFSMVAKYLKPDTVRVLEVHPPAPATELRDSIEVLRIAGI
ncbi:MAG: sugar phosphate isomerase/epimerase [bacterium]|nr:sugar phosphate isomerase/epimerase [bacterium]